MKLQRSVSSNVSPRPAKRLSILTMKRSAQRKLNRVRIHVQGRRVVKGWAGVVARQVQTILNNIALRRKGAWEHIPGSEKKGDAVRFGITLHALRFQARHTRGTSVIEAW